MRVPLRFAIVLSYARLTSGCASPASVPLIQEAYGELADDRSRNEQILNDGISSLEEGRSPLVLTERRNHLEFLADRLRPFTRHTVVLRGGMGTGQRREVRDQMEAIADDEERLMLATGRFVGEGFDDSRLDTLFLVMPVAWKGTLVQYAGRLKRAHRAKTELRVCEYVDRNEPVLARMFEKRLPGYRSMGYAVDLMDDVRSGEPRLVYDEDESASAAGDTLSD